MWSLGHDTSTGRTDRTATTREDLSGLHKVKRLHEHLGYVSVHGDESIRMLQRDIRVVSLARRMYVEHVARGRRGDIRPLWSRDVDSIMLATEESVVVRIVEKGRDTAARRDRPEEVYCTRYGSRVGGLVVVELLLGEVVCLDALTVRESRVGEYVRIDSIGAIGSCRVGSYHRRSRRV